MARTKKIVLNEVLLVQRRQGPLRNQIRPSTVLDESSSDEEEPQPQPLEKQRMSLEEAGAIARDVLKKSREEKKSQKEGRRSKDTGNIAKAPNN